MSAPVKPKPGPCPALAVALKTQPGLGKFFAAMPPSHQREYNQWIDSAKKAETKKIRAEKALDKIAEWGEKRAKK